jgi:Icc-related predicted phosphoesterase
VSRGRLRLHVVSDVHGRVDALATAGAGADALLVLGDLLLYLDYADPTQGILADLLGPDAGRTVAALRKEHRFGDLRTAIGAQLDGFADLNEAVWAAAKTQYRQLFDAMPTPAYCTYGNVDIPALWPEFVNDDRRLLDAQVIEIDGWRIGFVGGWPLPRRPRPEGTGSVIDTAPVVRFGADCSPDEYAAKVAALGHVDVLCSHVPPAVPELRWDTVTRRPEVASPALLAAIRETQPRYALFGHVHQPLQQRLRIGRTECVNVGHFRATGKPFVLTL